MSLIDSHISAMALRSLKSTAIALTTRTGRLLQGSEGFYKLTDGFQPGGQVLNLAKYCLSPSFDDIRKELAESPESTLVGKFTVGSRTGKSWTLNGFAYSEGEELLFVLEHDVEETHEVMDQMEKLNQSLGAAHREISKLLRKTRESEETYQHESLTDTLTGLWNRRLLDTAFKIEFARAIRERKPLGLIMGDLDHFKHLNDTFGHDTGDAVLLSFAKLIRDNIRPTDVAIRYGGEEFLIFLPGTEEKESAQIAERIRASCEAFVFGAQAIHITVSLGVTALREDDSMEIFIHRVDEAMYDSKHAGRNRVTIK